MEMKEIKKFLAGLSVAGLLSMGGVALPGAHAGSGWGAKTNEGAGGTKVEKPAGSGWGANKDGAVSAEESQKQPGKSGWGASKDSAVSAEEEKKAAEEEDKTKKKPAKSGWSG